MGTSEIPREPLIFGGTRPRPAPEPPSVAKTKDGAQLILSGYGIYLGKKSERLADQSGGQGGEGRKRLVIRVPLLPPSEVVIASRGVSFSSDLLEEFCERGIRLSFLDYAGRPYAMLTSPILTATVESRREQLLAYNDARGLEFARVVVRGKVRNQRHLLLYFGKYLKQSDPSRYESVVGTARKLRALELQVRKVRRSFNPRATPGADRAWKGLPAGCIGRL